jgi:hypothetical protein
MMFIYFLRHTWNFDNGQEGCFEASFSDVEEAFEKFQDLQRLIETDKYDFNVKFSPYCEGDMYFIAYEDINSLVNRQELVLIEKEVY